MRFTYENVVSNYVRRFQTRVRRRKIGRNRILYNFYGSLCLRIKGPTCSFRGGGGGSAGLAPALACWVVNGELNLLDYWIC